MRLHNWSVLNAKAQLELQKQKMLVEGWFKTRRCWIIQSGSLWFPEQRKAPWDLGLKPRPLTFQVTWRPWSLGFLILVRGLKTGLTSASYLCVFMFMAFPRRLIVQTDFQSQSSRGERHYQWSMLINSTCSMHTYMHITEKRQKRFKLKLKNNSVSSFWVCVCVCLCAHALMWMDGGYRITLAIFP